MKQKTMRKLVALTVAFAFAFSGVLPALAAPDASTGLTRSSGGGSAPIVKAKWEMKTGTMGLDDSPLAGAQFNPPGVWDATMNYTACAIATDPDGIGQLDTPGGVYADIYYPAGKAIHDLVPSTDIHPDLLQGANDVGQGGCGVFKEENTLIKLHKNDGYELFCNQIRNNNTNLPTFNPAYNYNEICAADGELQKETAAVYCEPKTLKWEDPAGLYTVKVFAQDQGGNSSALLENQFEYLPLTSFEKDFSNVNYGTVGLSTVHKKIPGDLTFDVAGNSLFPTIRNLGNTRLYMHVAQDDMGLGQSSGAWNVEFDARVGNNLNDWKIYSPFGYKPTAPVWSSSYTQLEDILDLSETEEIDFSIMVKKFPDANTSYSGNMYLAATAAPFRVCEATPPPTGGQ